MGVGFALNFALRFLIRSSEFPEDIEKLLLQLPNVYTVALLIAVTYVSVGDIFAVMRATKPSDENGDT